jgi:hypothetical protein
MNTNDTLSLTCVACACGCLKTTQADEAWWEDDLPYYSQEHVADRLSNDLMAEMDWYDAIVYGEGEQ